jgi:hypothetical protein
MACRRLQRHHFRTCTEATVSCTLKTFLGAIAASKESKPRPEDTRTPGMWKTFKNLYKLGSQDSYGQGYPILRQAAPTETQKPDHAHLLAVELNRCPFELSLSWHVEIDLNFQKSIQTGVARLVWTRLPHTCYFFVGGGLKRQRGVLRTSEHHNCRDTKSNPARPAITD